MDESGSGCALARVRKLLGISAELAARPSVANSSPSEVSSGSVVVRMANKDEFPAEPPPPAVHGRRINALAGNCGKDGPSISAYYEPVVAFARDRLLGDEHGEIHEVLVETETDKPKLGDGVNIVVDPRGTVGELRLVHVGPPFYASGTRWAETGYCLHALSTRCTGPRRNA
jgi:hypothetical protein